MEFVRRAQFGQSIEQARADESDIAGGIGAEAGLQPENDGFYQNGEAPGEVLPLLKRASPIQAARGGLGGPDGIANRDENDFTADGALPASLIQTGDQVVRAEHPRNFIGMETRLDIGFRPSGGIA